MYISNDLRLAEYIGGESQYRSHKSFAVLLFSCLHSVVISLHHCSNQDRAALNIAPVGTLLANPSAVTCKIQS